MQHELVYDKMNINLMIISYPFSFLSFPMSQVMTYGLQRDFSKNTHVAAGLEVGLEISFG